MTGLKNNTSIMHMRGILRDFRISKVRTTSLMHIHVQGIMTELHDLTGLKHQLGAYIPVKFSR